MSRGRCIRCGRPDNHVGGLYSDCLSPVPLAPLQLRAYTRLLQLVGFVSREWLAILLLVIAVGLIAVFMVGLMPV